MKAIQIETYLYTRVLYFCMLISAVNIVGNQYAGLDPMVNVKWLILLPLAAGAQYFNKRGRYVTRSQVLIFGFTILHFIPSGWRTTGGHNYLTLSYILLVAISIGFLMKGWIRNALLALEFVVFVGLLYMQFTHPAILVQLSRESYVKDLHVQVPVVFFSTVYISTLFANAWRRERHRLEEYSDLLREQNEHLDRITKTDALTGLYNRRYLFEQLDLLMETGSSAVIVMLDIDDFKRINDRHGHLMGDQVIVGVGKALQGIVEGHGFIGRYGGDEFVMVFRGVQPAQALLIPQQIKEVIDQVELPNGIQVGVSGGMASIEPGRALDDSLACADELLYWVKQNGKGKIAGMEVETVVTKSQGG